MGESQTTYAVIPPSPEASKHATSAQKELLSRLKLPYAPGDMVTFIGKVSNAGSHPVTRHYFDHSEGGFGLEIVGDQRYWLRRDPEVTDREGPAMLFTCVARATSLCHRRFGSGLGTESTSS